MSTQNASNVPNQSNLSSGVAQPLRTADGHPAHPNQHALVKFLQIQPQGTLHRLYARPSACLAIFRLVLPLERQIIMTLLWLEAPIGEPTISPWMTREGKVPYREALKTLSSLGIIPSSKVELSINSVFKQGLREGLTGGGSHESFGVPAPDDGSRPPISIEQLNIYALERWETILHFMVTSGSEQVSARPSEGVLYQLEKSGLMTNEGGRRKISSGGFQFLFHSPHTQLWEFILSYLRMMAERPEMDMVDILGLLLMLSMTQLGHEYLTANLTAVQLTMVSDLRDFGLVHFREDSTTTFLPTRLATTLTSSTPPLPTSSGQTTDGSCSHKESEQGFIILETNYHVYAYTDNPLQIAVLNLFVSFKTRFSNLIIGTITRESVKKALADGITANQIISYIITHAHPQMRKNNPIIPVTVQDQIRLWEMEKHRVKTEEGYLYKDFSSVGDYEVVLKYARDLGVVRWFNGAKRVFFADGSGRTAIRQFIERRVTIGT